MMHPRRLLMPWAHRWGAYSTPGSIILKVTLGNAPEDVPAWVDVRTGVAEPAAGLDGGPVDRMLRHFSGLVQVSRVHASARGLRTPGAGHLGFDETEQAVGLARTFQIDLDDATDLADLIDALRHLAVVEQAYPHYLCAVPFESAVVADPEEVWQARDQIRAAEAMAYEPGDPAVIVAVVDTGALHGHPELRDRLRRGRDTVLLVSGDLPSGVRLVDITEADGDPEDAVGHGTSCAGIVGARGDAMPPGLGGACSVLPIRVLGAALFPGKAAPVGLGAIADIDAGVKTAIDLGAKVLNMSFGTPEAALAGDEPPHRDVIRYGLARGCILVAASGNSGQEEAYTPASVEGVIAVGAADGAGRPAPFSTRGPHVALAAPGTQVFSAGLHGYARVTGTSFAAPFVTAAVALLVSRAERRAFALDGRTARRILCASARPWPLGTPEGHGNGVLNVAAALQALDREIDTAAVPAPSRRPKHNPTTGHSGPV
jgi:subtilisin family serine protease